MAPPESRSGSGERLEARRSSDREGEPLQRALIGTNEPTQTLRRFYDSASVMMGTVEITEDDILHVSDNQAAAIFFGTTPEAMQGRTARALGVPEPYISMWLGAYRKSVHADGPVRFEYEHAGEGWLKVTVNYIGLSRGQQRFLYVVDDVSDLKNSERALQEAHDQLEGRVEQRTEELAYSEQRFSQAFYSNPIPACMTTFGRETFVEVNEAFLSLTGYVREEVVSKTAFELGMWSSSDNQRKVNAALAKERRFHELDLQVRVKDGGVRDVLISAEVIRLDDHEHEGFLKMFYDVTERKQTEEQLHEAVQQVMNDASWFSRKLMEQLAHIRSGSQDDAEVVELSKRERQVLGRMATGLSNDAIAAELAIKPQTVRNYITTIYDKLGVHSRTEAVVWARERGIVGL